MGRIWDALVAEVKAARDASAPERLIASLDAALAGEADAVRELGRWRQWAIKVAPEAAEGTNADALAEQVARLRDLAGASAADLVGAGDARDALREIEALTRGG